MITILLDTNTAIDLVLARMPERHAALGRIVSLCSEGDRICLPSLGLKDISYYLENSRHIKEIVPSRQERSDLARRARQVLLGQCTIVAVDEAIARAAHLNTDEPDYDDALVAECARAVGADVILTSDKAAFQHASVPKISPEDYAGYLELKRDLEG